MWTEAACGKSPNPRRAGSLTSLRTGTIRAFRPMETGSSFLRVLLRRPWEAVVVTYSLSSIPTARALGNSHLGPLNLRHREYSTGTPVGLGRVSFLLRDGVDPRIKS